MRDLFLSKAFRQEMREEFSEIYSVLKRWHATAEGKASIYVPLIFATIAFSGAVLARAQQVPHVAGAIYQQSITLKLLCKANGKMYPYGVYVLVKIEQDAPEWQYLICNDSGRWVAPSGIALEAK